MDRLITFSLNNRLLILFGAIALCLGGLYQMVRLPIDVLPNLNRPRVVVITEAHGMAPEEIETLINFPLESALIGSPNVQAVRSSCAAGISVIYVEFDWNTDINLDRQIVNERLQLVSDQLPEGTQPTLAPISSIMGQVLMYGVWSEGNKTSPMDVRTISDWVIRKRLLKIPGVSQVFTIGGNRMQFQVLVDPDKLRRYEISLHEVHKAVEESNLNVTGGYLDQQGAQELLVRGIGRLKSMQDLRDVTVAFRNGRTVTLQEVATIKTAGQVKRGDASAYSRVVDQEGYIGGDAVVLTVNKQPGSDTRSIDEQIAIAMQQLQQNLPDDIQIANVYSQRSFIDRAVNNVVEALADGGVLVVLILFLFLLSFRTTFITLTAIPVSIIATASVFAAFGLSINTMTLGGLAVAIGELVDDAIVDVENIFRRLKENAGKAKPDSLINVVREASIEVRAPIVFGTAIVVLVFLPVFALEGMVGKIFVPLGIAYVVSLIASLLVSVTLTPVLASFLLTGRRVWRWTMPLLSVVISAACFYWLLPRFADLFGFQITTLVKPWIWVLAASPAVWLIMMLLESWLSAPDANEDGLLLRAMKWAAGGAIGFSARFPLIVIGVTCGLVATSVIAMLNLDHGILPPFNEGSVQANAILKPGTSLAESNRIGKLIDQTLLEIPEVRTLVRRTGRAELDEHAEGVNVSEIVMGLVDGADRSVAIEKIRETLGELPGVTSSTEQPLAHLISHMLSGVKAKIAIKVFGDDLESLRTIAEGMKADIESIDGLTDLLIEQQTNVKQLRIEVDRDALVRYGLHASDVMLLVETAMKGKQVGTVLLRQRAFDLVVRLAEDYRESESKLRRLAVDLPDGGVVALESLTKIYPSYGPNQIRREQAQRRIVIQANVAEGRGAIDVVNDVQRKLANYQLPPGYWVEYGGEFESERAANLRLAVLSVFALIGMFLVLYTLFRNVNFSFQVLIALPAAFVGAVTALVLTDQNLTIAATIGFISLCGIASRNGILLLSHYLHLVEHEGEDWTSQMMIRAGQERLAPVLMTALTSGIGLLPLALAAGEPGKEILYPIATVIVGGLLTSTAAEFTLRPALFKLVGQRQTEKTQA